jgi:hypothetical protein
MRITVHFDDFGSSTYEDIDEIGEIGNFTVFKCKDGLNSHYINTVKIATMDVFDGVDK